MMQSDPEDLSSHRISDYKPSSWAAQPRPRPPFKLCFAYTQEIGRSEFSKPRLPGRTMPIITPKFYSVHDNLTNEEDAEVNQLNEEITKIRLVGPREKYDDPILESQRYGWYQNKFIEIDPKVDKLHFPKRTSDMVKIQSILHNASKADRQFQQFQMRQANSKNK